MSATGRLINLYGVHVNQLLNVAKIMFNAEQVNEALDKMSQQITNDLKDKCPVALCVVKGGIYLTGQLMQRMDFKLELDYIHASRYENSLEGNIIKWHALPKTQLKDRHILIIDDILDQGITLKAVNDWCISQGAISIYNAVLVNKKVQRSDKGIQIAECFGLTAENEYLFGCGLDVKGFYRNQKSLYYIPKNLIPEVNKHI